YEIRQESKPSSFICLLTNIVNMSLDDADRKMLEILSKDSRTSNVAIAKSLGLTEGAVRWRMKRLIDSGVIRAFTVEVAESASNYAVLMIKAKGETKKMMSQIVSLGVHMDAYEISGEYDGCVILEGASMEDIDSKIDKIRKVKEVADTRTFITFRRW